MSNIYHDYELHIRRIIREELTDVLEEFSRSRLLGAEKGLPTELMTVSEVAEMLRLSTSKIYDFIRASKENGFPVMRIGQRTLRFNRDDVQVWVKNNSQ